MMYERALHGIERNLLKVCERQIVFFCCYAIAISSVRLVLLISLLSEERNTLK